MNLASRISLLNWLADRLILEPTTHPIETDDRQRHVISSPVGEFELWSIDQLAQEQPVQPVVVLKFPGTGGRAERVRQHPVECWPDVEATVYAVNPPGYGRSPGTARVNNMPPVADAAFHYVASQHPNAPLLVVGNSLGCLPALYLAARQRIGGVYLRNPAVVHQLIRQRWKYNWWNAGLARWLAKSLPQELDAYVNAAQAKAPCLLVTSGNDKLVPRGFQDQLAANYRGPLRQFVIRDAAHHDSIPDEQRHSYLAELDWLKQRLQTSEAGH